MIICDLLDEWKRFFRATFHPTSLILVDLCSLTTRTIFHILIDTLFSGSFQKCFFFVEILKKLFLVKNI